VDAAASRRWQTSTGLHAIIVYHRTSGRRSLQVQSKLSPRENITFQLV